MSDLRLLDASLNTATLLLRALSARDNEHEENLTGALQGLLLSSNALLVLFAGIPLQLSPSQLWWSSYGKYRSKDADKTEAGSGADFALMTIPEPGRARIVIFQAKRGIKTQSSWEFDANRVPKPLKSGETRDPQMLVLVDTAKRLTKLAGKLTKPLRSREVILAEIEDHAPAQEAAGLHDLDWVHYLIYTAEEPLCIALKHLSVAYAKELKRKRKQTIVQLDGKTDNFIDLVGRGVGANAKGWLEFKEEEVINLLPELLPLMPVIVGDGTGKFGLTIERDQKLYEAFLPITLDIEAGPLKQLLDAVAALIPPTSAPITGIEPP